MTITLPAKSFNAPSVSGHTITLGAVSGGGGGSGGGLGMPGVVLSGMSGLCVGGGVNL